MEGHNTPRPYVTATFPASSEYADFILHIERPIDENGQEVLNRGWDLLVEREDGTASYNHWADDWEEVLLYFVDEPPQEDVPAWIAVGLFRDAIFPDESSPSD